VDYPHLSFVFVSIYLTICIIRTILYIHRQQQQHTTELEMNNIDSREKEIVMEYIYDYQEGEMDYEDLVEIATDLLGDDAEAFLNEHASAY
jgi:hypothetical protein